MISALLMPFRLDYRRARQLLMAKLYVCNGESSLKVCCPAPTLKYRRLMARVETSEKGEKQEKEKQKKKKIFREALPI